MMNSFSFERTDRSKSGGTFLPPINMPELTQGFNADLVIEALRIPTQRSDQSSSSSGSFSSDNDTERVGSHINSQSPVK